MLKEQLLEELEQNRENVLSGQLLADNFNVSRNAVWKAVKALKEEGHDIESVPQKGYRLKRESDVISREGIISILKKTKGLSLPEILVFDELDSTNNEARRVLSLGHPSKNAIIIAKEQTAGRGRKGHSFYSPKDSGLYMSVILAFDIELSQSLLITIAAAVSVVRVVSRLCRKQLMIKWVNDLFYNGKKVSGILTEAVSDFESGKTSDIIIGIGINIGAASFPEELRETAGALCEDSVTKNELAAEIYMELLSLCGNPADKAILEEYRACSMLLGQKISINTGKGFTAVTAVDITDDGFLKVRYPDGSTKNLRDCEIVIDKTVKVR